MKQKGQKNHDQQQPTFAPGSNNLDKNATAEEIAEGDYTEVTKLVYDEYDPSEPRGDR